MYDLTAENGRAMVLSRPERVTQRKIAELAGVSQATVSLVLNGKTDSTTRIPEETRQRVLEVIRETTYVADPAARSLAGVGNNLVGVFTYEHAFPNATSDFYTPLLMGIESAAESIGVDLLMFTSAPVTDGRRQLFHEKNRLRLADGCLLLGREMDAAELARLVATGYPFVAVGRRDGEGVPYVGADYVTTTASLARRAIELGHEHVFYLHLPYEAESTRDRLDGLRGEVRGGGLVLDEASTDDIAQAWSRIRSSGATVLFVEDPAQAAAVHDLAISSGVDVPGELSIVVLGESARPTDAGPDFTRLVAPRPELGSRAVELLHALMRGEDVHDDRILLDCVVVDGETLAAVRR